MPADVIMGALEINVSVDNLSNSVKKDRCEDFAQSTEFVT